VIGLLGILSVLTLLVGTTVALVRWSERRLDPGADARGLSGPAATEADAVASYLDRLKVSLTLPAADVAEVSGEIQDHLRDSIAALEDEGFVYLDAVIEALGRLGPAAELGRQLSSAHQSTRRLLAGAGGGVFAAAGGLVLGWIGGIALAYLVVICGALGFGLLSRLALPVPDFGSDGNVTVNSLMMAGSLLVGAAVSTRYAVHTSAGLSRRTPHSVAPFWAVAGAIAFAWLAVFEMRGPQSWPGFVACLCVPVVSIGAALVRIERTITHAVRWALLAGLGGSLTLLASLGLMLAVTLADRSSPTVTASQAEPDMHFGLVAPLAPQVWLPDGTTTDGGWTQPSQESGTTFYVDIDATELANWHDLRFEAWRGLDDNEAGLDPGFSTPLVSQPAARDGTTVAATIHFERMRDASSWWVFLTGLGPDGQRYRLGETLGGGSSIFYGSAWDWLTASQ